MRHRVILYLVGALLILGGFFLVDKWVLQRQILSKPVQNKLQITASFYPLYFFTKEIAGEDADIKNLTPAGAEPHEYEPTPMDIVHLEESQVVVVNGLVEPWIKGMQQDFTQKQITLVVTNEVDRVQRGEALDPHTWLSPKRAQKMVGVIRDALSQKDPEHADRYRSRAEKLTQKLGDLDAEFQRGLQGCAKQQFITAHEAFGYLAADYGLTQIGIAGLSPEVEPSSQTLAAIATMAKQQGVAYIFVEPLASAKFADTLAREVGAQILTLNPLEGLTDAEIKSGKTYVTEMQQNLAHLRTALTCPTLTPTP